jgi:NAD(P)-dependent dehydrogenase (short-subunit alcohol dehydrogenase family)
MGLCDGRTAFVTGSSRGIGAALARRLAAEGAAVVVTASQLGPKPNYEGSLQDTVALIEEAGGRAAAVACDLSDGDARADLVKRASDAIGAPIDILVNNAAGAAFKPASITELSVRRRTFEINFQAPIDLIQQALPSMRERREGWILNISTASSSQPVIPYVLPRMIIDALTIYGASKAALERATVGLACELSGSGVHVNALSPTAMVPTQDAQAFAGVLMETHPEQIESMETMVEAAVALCHGQLSGLTVLSRDLLHMLQRPVYSLDGRDLLSDAFTVEGRG